MAWHGLIQMNTITRLNAIKMQLPWETLKEIKLLASWYLTRMLQLLLRWYVRFLTRQKWKLSLSWLESQSGSGISNDGRPLNNTDISIFKSVAYNTSDFCQCRGFFPWKKVCGWTYVLRTCYSKYDYVGSSRNSACRLQVISMYG